MAFYRRDCNTSLLMLILLRYDSSLLVENVLPLPLSPLTTMT